MLINFFDLFIKQKELDIAILEKHHLTYGETLEKRFLSLYVELSELANATRCFKYWSNKLSEEKERVMDEYADGLHFLLSIGIALNIKETTYEYCEIKEDLTSLFLQMYQTIDIFYHSHDEKDYQTCFQTYLQIAFNLDMKKDDIFSSYLKKLDVNYLRQENNY